MTEKESGRRCGSTATPPALTANDLYFLGAFDQLEKPSTETVLVMLREATSYVDDRDPLHRVGLEMLVERRLRELGAEHLAWLPRRVLYRRSPR